MTTSSPTILIVEDDADIREMLRFSLVRVGYQVREAMTAEEAIASIDLRMPELVLIDWMLPGMSGVDLVRYIRRDELIARLPLLMLTARGTEVDKLKGFDCGVDDYLVKPFSPKELVARIRALLRRTDVPENSIIEIGGIRLDLENHRAEIDGAELPLGPTEFRLLTLFMRNPDRAFQRSALLDRVWGRSVYIEERTVDVHVMRVRKLLKRFNRHHLIQTVRGVGYRFSERSRTSD